MAYRLCHLTQCLLASVLLLAVIVQTKLTKMSGNHTTQFFDASQEADAAKQYYDEYGYVVFKQLVPQILCLQAMQHFEQTIHPYTGYLYRQASGAPEKHQWTEHGYMLNSILNFQDLTQPSFADFRNACLNVVTTSTLQTALDSLMGDSGKIVQTMYFEGNPVTWAHQDCYYLDASEPQRMIAGWFALEDIAPGAGRFYIYPGSHKLALEKNSGEFNIAFEHDRYKALVQDKIEAHGFEQIAPALEQGDVLLWDSRTIHGSLATTTPEHSRRSLTAHYIPSSTDLLQFQSRIRKPATRQFNNMTVYQPKPMTTLKNRLELAWRLRLPALYNYVRNRAILRQLKQS